MKLSFEPRYVSYAAERFVRERPSSLRAVKFLTQIAVITVTKTVMAATVITR